MRLGGVLAIGVAALILGPAAVVGLRAEGWSLGPADLSALRFTLMQAALSAALSALLAVPLARALHRRRFAGRTLLIALLSAPFVLPVVAGPAGGLWPRWPGQCGA